MTPVLRLDFGRLAKAQPVAGGGVRVTAHLTRTGVFLYRNADGSERRELRLPEEVFRPESLATLAYAPVTDLHPNGLVRNDNWRAHSIGVVAENARRDGEWVAGDLVIQDGPAIKSIDDGDRSEVSLGYSCKLDMVPGVWNGERYDAVQRSIVYNHCAIGPKGWARAGAGAALRLDGGAIQTESPGNDAGQRRSTAMTVFKVDGKDLEMSAEAYQFLVDVGQQARTRIDALTQETAALKGERDRLQGIVDTHKPTDIESAVKARLDTRTKAVKMVGTEFKFDGLADRDVMIAAIKVAEKDFNADGKSDDYIRGVFESKLASHSTLTGNGGGTPPVSSAPKADGPTGDGTHYAKVRNDSRNALADLWMQPINTEHS